MMTISDPTFLYLLVISNATLLAAGCIAILRFQEQRREFEKFWSSPTGTALADEKNEAGEQLILMNLRLERRIAALHETVEALVIKEFKTPVRNDRSMPIENAVRMARDGASVEDLTRSCGLNIGEARLLQKMHSKVRPIARVG